MEGGFAVTVNQAGGRNSDGSQQVLKRPDQLGRR